MPSDRDRLERLSPSSPRVVPTDPAPASRTITIQSPNQGMLSPSRALGGQNPHPHRMSRSHRGDDQEARERQMQQDIESAMSMCKSPCIRSLSFHLKLRSANGDEEIRC
jgi:hypothetical protein